MQSMIVAGVSSSGRYEQVSHATHICIGFAMPLVGVYRGPRKVPTTLFCVRTNSLQIITGDAHFLSGSSFMRLLVFVFLVTFSRSLAQSNSILSGSRNELV